MERRWMGGLIEQTKTPRRPATRRLWVTIACRVATAGMVVSLSACEGWGPHETVSSPSGDPTLRASIMAPATTVALTPGLSEAARAFQCSSGMDFTGPVDIVMAAGQDVDLHSVTITLVDNTGPRSFGGFSQPPSNTFDEKDLASAFGSTGIPAGTTRTLTFHTRLPCGSQVPDSVAADIRFLEASGRRNSVMVTAPFASFVRVSG
jgi:hypothetical protein